MGEFAARDYRRRARKVLAGHWGAAIAAWIVPIIIILVVFSLVRAVLMGTLYVVGLHNSNGSVVTYSVLLSVIIILAIIFILFYTVLLTSYGVVMLHWYDLNSPPSALSPFTIVRHHWWGFLKLLIVTNVLVVLWSLLLYIPGIVKTYSYSQALFIYYDRVKDGQQRVSVLECITASRQMMDGHKGQLFFLLLSFIGWWLLGIATVGIAFLWIIPYVTMTQVVFYRNLPIKRNTNDDLYSTGSATYDRFNRAPGEFDMMSENTGHNELANQAAVTPAVNEQLYGEVMGKLPPQSRKSRKGLKVTLIIVTAILVVGALSYVILHADGGDGTAIRSIGSSSHTSHKHKRATKSHKGITPVSDFDDGMDLTDKEDIKHNRFDPQSGVLRIDYDNTVKVNDLRGLTLNWTSEPWLDSTVSVDKGWIANFKPVTTELGDDDAVTVSSVVILHLTVKTGKYDNNYYPTQGKLVTNLGSTYDASVSSQIIDGGVPHDQTRGTYMYFYLKNGIKDLNQIQTINYSFDAYAEDKQTEDLNNNTNNFEMNLDQLNN